MDEEIKTQANDELAQALASVSDDNSGVADPVTTHLAANPIADDDFSDFSQSATDTLVADDVSYSGNSEKSVLRSETDSKSNKSQQVESISQISNIPVSKLESIKERALQELRPLMETIDIPSTEKYETYLMMLRASDDQSLIEPTFKAARKIEDDKLRAKALLDIVHEINYLNSKTA
jgi:hypothetical protein